MFTLTLADFFFLGLVSCCVAGLASAGLLLANRRNAPPIPLHTSGPQNAVWLFQDGLLVDASPATCEIMQGSQAVGDDWANVHAGLCDRFAGLPQDLDTLETPNGPLILPAVSAGGPAVLHLERLADTIRLEIMGTGPDTAGQQTRLLALSHQSRILEDANQKSPYPAWRTDPSGKVLWANNAYKVLLRKICGDGCDDGVALFPLSPGKTHKTSQRMSLTDQVFHQPYWYEVTTVPLGVDFMHYASDINAVVAAEIAQRNFVQTLAKTFAQLSTGLAIFDRKQQLVLFNPALIDLTGLSAEFLSMRPDLLTFFDRLRDARMMPEPKSYTSWRSQIAEVVAAASDGRYQETWSLPSGLTYQITGRPHPDGALAFLIEDVSAEVSLTRRFREQLGLGQLVIDQQSTALAVFSPQGVLVLSNAAFESLWGLDPANDFANFTIFDATRCWQEKSRASPFFHRLQTFVTDFENRTKWGAEISLRTGATLRCAATPLPSGETLVTFDPVMKKALSASAV